ncbi:MAG: hypothetical protein A3C11_02850 [Candidatus Sungbacteria bacterium RIFCSPHIGHO2_02_FULL_49_12]|uniref:Large ribosomal subunit protein uL15 n=1 Tax=Candidatus Sungbacteria bacterium RIFCSPHIGHO2_02_FULL_49_12 TaxID=1802271 RepID=A0A1G2KPJ6_9BACT|nr:MAG: hypothetical protein A3C11_02850 [Candidatus Sungbacteria bacterium RIFCSPHIGHO2_02_FULL_49_12]
MQLHTLKRNTKRRHGQRIGRGGKRGTTAGRGTKGQKSRAGHKIRPQIRDTIKRIPKLRGHKFRSFQEKTRAISLDTLAHNFSNGDIISMEVLVKKNLVRSIHGALPPVKILGGTLDKKLSVVKIPVSKSARAMIEKAGGSVDN